MAKEPKLEYEVRSRGKHYVGIWLGDHCLCAVCVKKPRGMLDALDLLRAVSCHKELLAACKKYEELMEKASRPDRTQSEIGRIGHELDAIMAAAIEKAK